MWKEILYVFDIILVTFFFVFICILMFISKFIQRSEQDRGNSCCGSLILDVYFFFLECIFIAFGATIFAGMFFIMLLRYLFYWEGMRTNVSKIWVLLDFRNVCILLIISFVTLILYRYLKVQEVIVKYKKRYPNGDPLILSIEFNNFVNIRDIVRLGSYDLNKKTGKDSKGNMYTPLQMARRVDNKKVILYLKKHDAK